MRAHASAAPKRAVSSEPRVTVVVLAAGKGVRMNSRIPKVLHPVAGRPMLLWSMAAARALDPARTLVVVNPAQDGVQAVLNGEGQTVSQDKQLGPGLWRALAKLEDKNRAGEYYLTDIVRLIKGKVHTLPVEDSDEILGINDRRQLAEAERVMRQRILDGLMSAGVTIADPASTFIDADVQIGRDTVVLPFSLISGESNIGEDCVIGPFAQIRDSIIGDACRI